jgi:hypothetical protein
MRGTSPSNDHCLPSSAHLISSSRAVWERSARFCLPQASDRCSSALPGSTIRDLRARRVRADCFATSLRPGRLSSLRNSLRASATEFSEPATAIQTDAFPRAGSLTL